MFLLTGLFPIRERISLLPGLLPRNGEECKLIEENILTPRVSDREKTVFHEMVDLEVDDDAPAEEQWSKDEWYCLDCIKELYRQRFLPWWKKTRQGDGSTAREDCWYGYNCRTMTHKPAHASKLGVRGGVVPFML
uniref:DNA helicase (EC) n=1 Tax=Ganoderma boninense TaxID=34458 RepID=A0A5K1K612_9APHY|nr:DNA helicase (EC [Ganoderma boninense]